MKDDANTLAMMAMALPIGGLIGYALLAVFFVAFASCQEKAKPERCPIGCDCTTPPMVATP